MRTLICDDQPVDCDYPERLKRKSVSTWWQVSCTTYIAADIFGDKIGDVFHGTLVVDKFPWRRIIASRFVESRRVQPGHGCEIVYVAV